MAVFASSFASNRLHEYYIAVSIEEIAFYYIQDTPGQAPPSFIFPHIIRPFKYAFISFSFIQYISGNQM